MKLSIYVPDERAGDIERWRERLNFSQLFLQSLDSEIATRAQASEVKGKDMKAVIERLKREISEAQDEGRGFGYREGVRFAKEFLGRAQMLALIEGEKLVEDAMSECGEYFDIDEYIA